MQLTALQVADAWVAAGGPKSRATEWTAIALGESAYRTDAVSSAGALGLWQIMPFNFAPNGVDINMWQDPVSNATVAVRMSGHGTNCAAWDSCYADITASGRYTFLGWPEAGSADHNNLAIVSAQLGTDKLGGAVPPVGPVISPGVLAQLARQDAIFNRLFRTLDVQLLGQRMYVSRIGAPGWRP